MIDSIARLCTSCLLLTLVACGPESGDGPASETAEVDAAQESARRVVESVGPYCFELTSARDRVLLGEPLTLLVSLENCSDQPVEIRDLLAPEYGLLGIRVGFSDDERFYDPPVRRDGRGREYVELAVGEAVAATIPVYFARDGWLLVTPGQYSFQAEYSVDDVEVTSDRVIVRVDTPSDERHRSAANSFMSPAAAKYYFLGGGNDRGSKELRTLAEEYPDTPWAAYARLGLAIDAVSNSTGESREAACQSLFASINDVEKDWISALRGYKALSDCTDDTNLDSDWAGARANFVRRHPMAAAILHD